MGYNPNKKSEANTDTLIWKTIKVPIEEVTPLPNNPRSIKEDKEEDLQVSIDELGNFKPLICDQNYIILGGNQRYKQLRKRQEKNIEISIPSRDLTEKEKQQIILQDNLHSGEFDIDILHKEFNKDILDRLGFDIPDNPIEVEEDNYEEPEEKNIYNVEYGDIYQLGEHRLMCGDSTKIEDVEKLMDGKKADMVFTDPPYGIDYQYNSYEDTEDNWYRLMNDVVPIARTYSDFVIMPCCRIKRLEWWYKNHTPDWLMCWYKGSPGHRSHIGFNDWEPHLVWGKPRNHIHDYWQTRCGFETDNHSCPKPIEYSAWIIERAINSNDIVLDVFGGSGSTLMAADQLNRKCYMMELDPHYCSVIIDRWQQFTGREYKKLNK